LEFFVGRLNRSELGSWYALLKQHFGKLFFADGIVKDVIGGDPVEECRFRPNACIALAKVPLGTVDADAARAYLKKCDESLRGPLGMRTLPSTDPAYNGVYDNSDETAGYNYHNGPEWVWLFGYFIIACNRFDVFTQDQMIQMVEQHELHIRRDSWRSLPELTNFNGHNCPFSCPAQAWSVCCLLEAISNFRK
jgi:glycogen debranching enzyme